MSESFHWLASDSWGKKAVPVLGQERAAEGAITILPERVVLKGAFVFVEHVMLLHLKHLHAEFDEYFMSLNPARNKRNVWFKEFWEKHFECTFNSKNKNKKNIYMVYKKKDIYDDYVMSPSSNESSHEVKKSEKINKHANGQLKWAFLRDNDEKDGNISGVGGDMLRYSLAQRYMWNKERIREKMTQQPDYHSHLEMSHLYHPSQQSFSKICTGDLVKKRFLIISL